MGLYYRWQVCYLCVYAFMCVYVCVCLYVCAFGHMQLCVHVHVCSYVCMCLCWGQLRLLYSSSPGHLNLGILAHGPPPHIEYGKCDTKEHTFCYLYDSQYFGHSI